MSSATNLLSTLCIKYSEIVIEFYGTTHTYITPDIHDVLGAVPGKLYSFIVLMEIFSDPGMISGPEPPRQHHENRCDDTVYLEGYLLYNPGGTYTYK